MGLVDIEVAVERSFVIKLQPADDTAFVVTTITVFDESLSPVWMLVADNAAIAESAEEIEGAEARSIEIRGFETPLHELSAAPRLTSCVGRRVHTIKFADVPAGFHQLIPSVGHRAAIANGKTYHVFVNGSESGTAQVQM